MKIAVNTRLLLPDRLDGIGRFTCETLRIITQSHPEHEFLFLFDRKFHESFIFSENIRPIVAPPQARHPLLFLAWFELSLPYLFNKLKPDLFLSPDGFLSLNTRVPSVAVIHDLNFEHFPADIPWAERTYYLRMFPKFARKAVRLATVSEYSKQDIHQLYKIPENRIDVVYNGSSSNFRPLSSERKETVRRKLTGGNEYFIFVGSLHPRKNLVNLFKAFDQFKDNDPSTVKLVIAGARMWWTDEIRQAYEGMQHRQEVIFTGRVIDQDLADLMASAMALTYVSIFEGFGIPILEAFSCNTPVITSGNTSMPEVAGDAALLVNPFSVESISGAMRLMARDPLIRASLSEKGRKQGEMFSWEATAEKLWNTIELSST